jgi:hypothetical protein
MNFGGSGPKSASYLKKQFKKICLEGSGKGRIEIVGSKYTFGYESVIDRKKNDFNLALDFPVVGETNVSLSLNPKLVRGQIGHTDLAKFLNEKLNEHSDREQMLKTTEEFFVFASDFIHYSSDKIYPSHFISSTLNDHFLLSRENDKYLFVVDNFADNQIFFERTVFKIFSKSNSLSDPIMTLFLVPQVCESK